MSASRLLNDRDAIVCRGLAALLNQLYFVINFKKDTKFTIAYPEFTSGVNTEIQIKRLWERNEPKDYLFDYRCCRPEVAVC